MFTHSRIYKLRGVFSSKMKHEQRRTVLKKIHSPEEKPSMPVFQYASDEVKLKSRVYVWGFAQYGALGVASYVKPKQSKLPALVKQHRPARLNFAERHEVNISFPFFSINYSFRSLLFKFSRLLTSHVGMDSRYL